MVSTALRLTISSIVIKMGAKTVFFTASVQSNQLVLPNAISQDSWAFI